MKLPDAPRPASMALIGVVLSLGACGASGESVDQPWPSTTAVAAQDGYATEHFVRDDRGAYVCVLRRPEDLAALRASFGD